jgi:hypothetical protein
MGATYIRRCGYVPSPHPRPIIAARGRRPQQVGKLGDKMTVAEIGVRLDSVAKLVDAHDKILVRGNGEPSLQEVVRGVQKFIADLQKEKEEAKDDRKFYARLVIGFAITNILSILFGALIWFVSIYPAVQQVIANPK